MVVACFPGFLAHGQGSIGITSWEQVPCSAKSGTPVMGVKSPFAQIFTGGIYVEVRPIQIFNII